MTRQPGLYVAEAGGLPAPVRPAARTRGAARISVAQQTQALQAAIAKATEWLVFEPNSEATWARLRAQISDFLFAEWQAGRLMGSKPEQAFHVRCDHTTMTRQDIDNGRLVCLIGVAIQKPAEFAIFQLASATAGP